MTPITPTATLSSPSVVETSESFKMLHLHDENHLVDLDNNVGGMTVVFKADKTSNHDVTAQSLRMSAKFSMRIRNVKAHRSG
jgi:hypothetical protein